MFRLPLFVIASLGILGQVALAEEPKPAVSTHKTAKDIAYRGEAERTADPYIDERCRLDVYYPKGKTGFVTVVWFHGGGLTGGNRLVPTELKEKGLAVVAVNYRLYPKVKCPVYIEDAAAAVAWTFQHIAEYGGDPDRIAVAGHSAGGYLTSMVGLDKQWLAKHEIDADRIFALFPFSGHTVTHFTVRKERGIPQEQPIVDEFSPLYHVRKDAPPVILMTGDRELEMLGRYEENAYLWRMMKVAGHERTKLLEFDGFNHGGMSGPGHLVMLRELAEMIKAANAEAKPETK